MEQDYADEECPICGYLNKHLYLHETEGRYICDRCKSETQIPKYMQTKRVPLLTQRQLVAMAQNR